MVVYKINTYLMTIEYFNKHELYDFKIWLLPPIQAFVYSVSWITISSFFNKLEKLTPDLQIED